MRETLTEVPAVTHIMNGLDEIISTVYNIETSQREIADTLLGAYPQEDGVDSSESIAPGIVSGMQYRIDTIQHVLFKIIDQQNRTKSILPEQIRLTVGNVGLGQNLPQQIQQTKQARY